MYLVTQKLKAVNFKAQKFTVLITKPRPTASWIDLKILGPHPLELTLTDKICKVKKGINNKVQHLIFQLLLCSQLH